MMGSLLEVSGEKNLPNDNLRVQKGEVGNVTTGDEIDSKEAEEKGKKWVVDELPDQIKSEIGFH